MNLYLMQHGACLPQEVKANPADPSTYNDSGIGFSFFILRLRFEYLKSPINFISIIT